jgi:hypothetical protein
MKKFLKYLLYTAIGIGILIIITIIGNTIKISNSEAYSIAKKEIINNNEIIERVGKIKSFGRFPSGSIRMENQKYYAQLEIEIIGNLNMVKAIIYMNKNNNDDWVINEIFLYD